VEFHWPQIHVVVEFESKTKEQTTLENPRWDTRVTDRAKQDCVVPLELGDGRIGQHLTGGVVASRTQIVVGAIEAQAMNRGHSIKNFEALGYNFGSDPITGDHGKAV
jgi:hypothetical protein